MTVAITGLKTVAFHILAVDPIGQRLIPVIADRL